MHVLAAYSAKIRDMTLRPNLNSIATRLILFGLAIVIASSLARVFVLSNYLRKDLPEQSTAQLLTLANYVARDIDHNVVERHEISPLFSVGLFIPDTSGIALAGYASTNDSGGASFAERDYFKAGDERAICNWSGCHRPR